MACAGLYQQLPHLAVADTDDRYTVSSRIEAAGAGVALDARRSSFPSREAVMSALARMPKMNNSRELLNRSSASPEDVAEWVMATVLGCGRCVSRMEVGA